MLVGIEHFSLDERVKRREVDASESWIASLCRKLTFKDRETQHYIVSTTKISSSRYTFSTV